VAVIHDEFGHGPVEEQMKFVYGIGRGGNFDSGPIDVQDGT
jgi:hypothetical protein